MCSNSAVERGISCAVLILETASALAHLHRNSDTAPAKKALLSYLEHCSDSGVQKLPASNRLYRRRDVARSFSSLSFRVDGATAVLLVRLRGEDER